jgi:hypothetical protein
MTDADAKPRYMAGWAMPVLVLVGYWCLGAWLQYRAGAYVSEFGYDESSHYVTGLLVRDWLLSLQLTEPLAFLERFHSSYPLVGIGHWGPFFYGIGGVWFILFGSERIAVVLLPLLINTSTAWLISRIALPHVGWPLAVAAGALFLLSPVVQLDTASLMLDGIVGLLCLIAALAWARFMSNARAGPALGFGLVASAALLVKGNAGCLALLPGLAVLIGRRWSLLRRWTFWLPVPVVAVLAGPWTALTYGDVAAGFRYAWGWDYTSVAVPAYLRILVDALGPAVLLLGVVGLVLACIRSGRSPHDAVPSSLAALCLSVLIFQVVAPAAIQDRYLIPAFPPLIFFAALTLRAAADRLAGSARRLDGAVTALLILLVLPAAFDAPQKRRYHVVTAAAQVWAHRLPDNPAVLIAAHDGAEEAVVAELAMNDPARPSLFAVRGTRLLGGGGYNTHDYLPRFETAAEVQAAIDDYSIPLVLLHRSAAPSPWRHVNLVEEARALAPERWIRLHAEDRDGERVELYQIRGNDAAKADVERLIALSAPRRLRPAAGPAS